MSRTRFRTSILIPFLALAAPFQVGAQGHGHQPPADHLGRVHFATSCDAHAAPTFDHAVALLHSFEFGAAIRSFDDVIAADSSCAMAWWGIAMSRWSNPMAPGIRTA